MEFDLLLAKVADLVSEAKVGVFATIDERGRPGQRWMTPAFLRRIPGSLFAVTARSFEKSRHVLSDPNVSWLFQSRTLDRVASLRGRAELVDEPGFTAEVLEAIGPNLPIFWRVNRNPGELVVIETKILAASWFEPLKGERAFAEAPDEA